VCICTTVLSEQTCRYGGALGKTLLSLSAGSPKLPEAGGKEKVSRVEC